MNKYILSFLFLIITAIAGCAFLASCTAPRNEISDMVNECFKNKKSIKIEFTPYTMSQETLEQMEKEQNSK